jgi:type II secretory pathway component GspD/PulD (secretin)
MVFVLSSVAWAANEKLLDINFKNADLKDLLNTLAAQGGVHFIYDEQETEITGIVTIHLSKVTFGEALSIIAKSNNLIFTKEKDNRVYHISQLDTAVLKVDFDQGALSVLANNAQVAKLFELISQKSGVSYVVDPELKKERISIVFEKTPLEDGVNAILTQANYDIQPIGKITYIRKGQSKLQFRVEYHDNLLTVDAKDIPLNALAKDITEKSGSTIIADQNANPNVTIFFKNLSVSEGLNVICDTYNLQLGKEGSIWRINRKSNNARVRYNDKLLSVDVDGVDVAEITNEISRVTGINISLARDVRGMISAHFKNLQLDKALATIYEPQGWSVERLSKNYRVSINTNATQNIHVNYSPDTQLFDLEVQYAQLTPVLSEIARKADLNMVVMSSVNWSLSNIRLRDQTIDQILSYLLKGTVFTYRFVDQTYVIGDGLFPRPETSDFSAVKVYPIKYIKADQLLNSLPPIFPRQNFVIIQDKNSLIVTAPANIHALFSKYLDQVDIEAVENKTEVVKIKYMKAEDVMKYIPASIPKNDIIVVKEMNAITVTGPINLVNQVKQYIDRIDQPNPMIVFDVLVVKIDSTNSLDFGIKSILPTGSGGNILINMIEGKLAPGSGTTGALDSINAMIRSGKGKVLQNPTITTLNGYPATFSVTSSHTTKVLASTITNADGTKNDTYTPKTSDSGLAITITPWVSINDIITMEIKPTINEYSASDDPTLPDTAKNETNTTIRVKNKETIIISGIRSSRKEKTINKVPVLGDIPLFGLLFRNTSTKDIQQEFVIIITPTLVYDDPSREAANKRLNNQYSEKIMNEVQNQKDKGIIKDTDTKKTDKNDVTTKNTNQTDAIDNKTENTDASKETDGTQKTDKKDNTGVSKETDSNK